MSLVEYLKENLIDDIEDDQAFMEAEYHAVQTYCEIHGYYLTDADMETVRARGLDESFETWKENNV